MTLISIHCYGYDGAPNSLESPNTTKYEFLAFVHSNGPYYYPFLKTSMGYGYKAGLMHRGRDISVRKSLCNTACFTARTPQST
eukprot:3166530-Pleurochrysis_carterae.AAC.1